MNLGERRRQLAILRALGATRTQVTLLLLRETVVLGFTGTVLAIGTGTVLAMALLRIMAEIMGVAAPELGWSAESFLFALALGPGMALAATLLPARRAGRRAPLEDLVHRRADPGEDFRRWPAILGLALLASTGILVLGHGWSFFPPSFSPALMAGAAAIYLVGCILVIPLCLGSLLGFAKGLLKLILGMEGGLALRQLDRHRARTSLTVGVLVIAIVFAIAFGNSLLKGIRDIHDWLDHVAYADFYIRGSMPDVTTMITGAALPETLGAEIGACEGVERVDKFRWVPAQIAGRQVLVLVLTFSPDRPLPLHLVMGDRFAALNGLLRGDVVVGGTTLAKRLEVEIGDDIALETGQGPRRLRVAGITNEYNGGGMALYMDWGNAQRFFELQGVHSFLVTARPGAAPVVAEHLQALCRDRGLIFQSTAGLRDWFDRRIAGTVVFCWSLMSLVFVVASLGIVNTLTMNVLEQTRELGVLRAMGMKGGQVRKMILSEALAMGIISLLPGVLLGTGLAYLMALSAEPLQGHRHDFRLDLGFMCASIVAALVIAVVAGFLPARRAARLQVIQALQYE
jgi:putative ABC transport system permease protein